MNCQFMYLNLYTARDLLKALINRWRGLLSSGLMCEIVNCLHLPEKVREFRKPLTVATMSVDFNNKFVILTVDL